MPEGFNRLLVAWFASVTGDGMRFAALPLLALTSSPSPAAVSAVAAATALPWLVVALPAGALVDRLDPAAVISWANAGRALAAALLVVAELSGGAGIPLLCAVGFLLTAGETFADSAGQSLLVRLVPRDSLETANARFVGAENVGLDLVGPLAAGALFVVAHWLPFAVAAGIFLITAYRVLGLRGHRVAEADGTAAAEGAGPAGAILEGPGPAVSTLEAPGATDPTPGGPGSTGLIPGRVDRALSPLDGGEPGRPGGKPADVVEGAERQRVSLRAGFRVIFSDPQLRILVITVAIMSAAIAAAEGVLVLYSDNSLRLPAALYPTLLACYSVGLVLAAAAVSRWGMRLRRGVMMVGAVVVIGATLLVMGVFPHPVVAWVSFLAMGAAGGVWNVLSASRRQRRTPPSMIARVSSTFRAIAWGALPLGTALGGVVGQTWSVSTVFVAAGSLVLVLAAVAGRFLLGGADERPPSTAGEQSSTTRAGAAEPV